MDTQVRVADTQDAMGFSLGTKAVPAIERRTGTALQTWEGLIAVVGRATSGGFPSHFQGGRPPATDARTHCPKSPPTALPE